MELSTRRCGGLWNLPCFTARCSCKLHGKPHGKRMTDMPVVKTFAGGNDVACMQTVWPRSMQAWFVRSRAWAIDPCTGYECPC